MVASFSHRQDVNHLASWIPMKIYFIEITMNYFYPQVSSVQPCCNFPELIYSLIGTISPGHEKYFHFWYHLIILLCQKNLILYCFGYEFPNRYLLFHFFVITVDYLVFYRFNLYDLMRIHIFLVLILLCLFAVVWFRCWMLFGIHRSLCFFKTFFRLMIGSDR